ncbi:filamentous hemagglutinin N-terminal domain-containing protein [Nostoc sp. PCC 9305]|uniref:two-partner secretion domain-containing protein n=1 Tax=Nostoc sp. PCC 9305 TaxID=296636 RepID=UPI0039C63821
MTRKYGLHKCLQFGLTGVLGWLIVSIFASKTLAQQSNIVSDNTLGAESSQVLDNFQGQPIEVITGGAIRQINLFHSFGEFNVSEGRGAYFLSPSADIQNILARVTGNNPSEILGRLGTFGNSNPNVFLINPNGIVFGKDASLDVQGSFLGTTANGVQFGNQGVFSAINPQAAPLLTVNPSALFFTQQQRGVITTNQSFLGVEPGKTLALISGDIGLNGSILQAFGGRIELAAIAETGTVGINSDSSLSLPDNLAQANASISNSLIDVTADNGGSIAINAANLDISRSTIQAGIRSGLGTVNSQAGEITINTTDKLQISPQSFIINWVFPNAIGKGGDIRINTNSMSFTGFGYISASTWGTGDAGSIIVNANNDIALNGSTIFSIVETGAVGNAGNIDISTNSLSLNGGGRLNASTFGQGNGGNIVINARDRISIDGVNSSFRPSAILSTIENGAFGQGGDIQITAGSVSITNSAKLDVSVFGKGSGGNIIIDARNTVSVDGGVRGAETGSSIFSTLEEIGIGSAGSIRIKTESLSLTNGGEVQSLTRGQGNAGNIIVDARDSVTIDGFGIQDEIDRGSLGKLFIIFTSGIFSSAEEEARGSAGNILIRAGNQVSLKPYGFIASDVSPSAVGNAGNIEITTNSLLLDNADIRTATFGQGNAGNITIKAGDRISLDNDGTISSAVAQKANGNGGNTNITTGSLFLDNNARLSANTNGRGNAGNITIKASDRISLDNDSAIGSLLDDEGIGRGGDIRISTGLLTIAGAAQLDSSTFGEGDAGDIIIDADNTVLFTGFKGNFSSGILSTAERQGKGNGGDISISADSVVVADGASLSTITTKKGNAGNITIQARNEVNLVNEGDLRTITAGEGNAGNISVRGGAFSLSNSSALFSDTYAEGNAGNISVNAVNQLNLDKTSVISSAVRRNARGNGGTISIEGKSLSMTNGSLLQTNTFGRGNAGDVTINARGDISLSELELQEGLPVSTGISSSVASTGIGDAGDIRINARTLSMKDNASLEASTQGQGNSGNIFINVSDRVSLDSRAIISNIVGDILNPGEFGDGKGGTIRIDTGALSMLNGAQLQASTFGRGDAGDIIINARDSFLASGFGQFEGIIRPTAVFSVVASDSRGNGGNIRINTDSVFVEDGARFSVSTFGQGRAGNISINAGDAVVVDGVSKVGFSSLLSTATEDDASGRGGTITVNTNSFRVSNGGVVNAKTTSAFGGGEVTINANNFEAIQGGQIITTATNQGQAGNITLNADNINLSDRNLRSTSGLFANTTSTASGQGGNIQVNARQLNVSANAQVSVNSQGSGIAGNIDIKADTIKLSDRANIIAETASQDGGSINIDNANLILLRRDSLISATAAEGGNGGNININSKFIVAVPKENSDVSANAFEGRGGNVEINSQGIFGIEARPKPTEKSDITASSELGVSGAININVPDTSSIQNSFTELPPVIDTNALIANSCISRGTKRQNNSFTITGSGALTTNRPGVLVSNYTTGEVRGIETISRLWKKGDPIIEPTGVYRLDNGQLLLSRECSN